LMQALQKTNGLTLEAAELLGISKSAIYRRMEKYDIKN
jgi:transcriptional regulator of acetoin/glycerol metabolism